MRPNAMPARIMVLFALVAMALSLTAQSPGQATPTSPSILILQRSAAMDPVKAEIQFWDRVKSMGSPLVEPAQDNRSVLITFVWKGDAQTRNVVLVNTAVASSDLAESQLSRIAGTNVWFRTYAAPASARFVYELSVNDDMTPFDQVTDWGKRTAGFHTDPMNPRTFQSTIFGGRTLSYVEGPAAPPETWIKPTPGVARGKLQQLTFESKQLGNSRELWIYTPPGFESSKSAVAGLPLLMVFDGGEYVSSVPVPIILDNLIAAKHIPPMLAVFVANSDGQRDQELNANPEFADFISNELLPWLRQRFPIASSPEKNIVAGSSSGGLAAAFVAYKHPDLFGNVLSQSGAFCFAPFSDEEPELLPRLMSASDRKPIHFYLEVGTLEANGPSFKGVNMVSCNRHFRDVLHAKGYSITYHEYVGGHSDLNWRGGFAEGIVALIGK